jgi:hypothetical protein
MVTGFESKKSEWSRRISKQPGISRLWVEGAERFGRQPGGWRQRSRRRESSVDGSWGRGKPRVGRGCGAFGRNLGPRRIECAGWGRLGRWGRFTVSEHPLVFWRWRAFFWKQRVQRWQREQREIFKLPRSFEPQ